MTAFAICRFMPRRLRPLGALALLVVAMVALAARPVEAADPAKVLRVMFSIAETSFDPQFASDAASDAIIANVFETMLDYDYLARPVRLVPRTLEAMPEVADNGATYLCRIRKGIFFSPDPAFKDKRRELTAGDYAYALKRIIDPAVKSPWAWLLEGKLVGGEEARAKAQKVGRFDYDAPVAGLEVVDRYTLRIRLKAPDYRFPYVLAVPNTGAIAREIVETYGLDLGAHPVGTGPFVLAEYNRSSRIVLAANPDYRAVTYEPSGPVPAGSADVAAALQGRRLPMIDRIEVRIVEEAQSRWLSFLSAGTDVLELLPAEFVDQALDNGKIRAALAAKGIQHEMLLRPNVWFAYFNMEDPVVGGYTPEKIALRRAIAMAYNVDEAIRVLAKGRSVPAKSPVPPGIEGYDPALVTEAQLYDPTLSRALLDRFGYRDRDGDGYRELPDGKPLVLERWSTPTSGQRQADELWKKNMDAIGIRIAIRKDKLPELRKMARQGKIAFRTDGWNADYPDAENFMQLLYGPNAGQENGARFRLPEFDRLYDEARSLPNSPARTALFDRMTRLVVAYAPWRLAWHDIEDHFAHPWVRYYKPHPIRSVVWQYLDVDMAKRAP
ncbi:MAG: ABC transporter substrate-binding protein [Casimicrobiaceae bacterium]